MDDKLKNAVRSIVYREHGRASLSHVISTLRLSGWTKLGDVNQFAQKCELAGFVIAHQYKEKNNTKVIVRTFICVPEEQEQVA